VRTRDCVEAESGDHTSHHLQQVEMDRLMQDRRYGMEYIGTEDKREAEGNLISILTRKLSPHLTHRD